MASTGRAGSLLAARQRTSNAGLRRKTKEEGDPWEMGTEEDEAGGGDLRRSGLGKNRRSGFPLCKPGLLLSRACVRFRFTAAVQHQ